MPLVNRSRHYFTVGNIVMPSEPAHPINETDPIIAPLVGRARAAMAAFKDADQARVDEVVTAVSYTHLTLPTILLV